MVVTGPPLTLISIVKPKRGVGSHVEKGWDPPGPTAPHRTRFGSHVEKSWDPPGPTEPDLGPTVAPSPPPSPSPPRAKAPAAFLVAIVSTGSCRLQSSSICYVPVAPAAGRRSYSRAVRRVHAVLRSFSR